MLQIRPIDLKAANEYVSKYHRHNGPVLVHRFSLSVYDNGRLCGVAICGNPTARKLDDGLTVEVKQLCTDGTKNACSILYARSARVAREMGYHKIITYITEAESGVSLRASGFVLESENCGGAKGWNMPSRPRVVKEETLFGEVAASYPLCPKKRYSKILSK